MKVAVVGHVEWCEFVRVDRVPQSGEIIVAHESWDEMAGGAGIAAVVIGRLAGNCLLYTSVGADDLGSSGVANLEQHGVRVYSERVSHQSTNRAFVQIDDAKERTIIVAGTLRPSGKASSAAMPWQDLKDADAVYFVSGDVEALQYARRAKFLVATARELPVLQQAGVQLDVLVCSQQDRDEAYEAGDLKIAPRFVVKTMGAAGGVVDPGGKYPAEYVAEEYVVDAHGCGDSFAAGLTFGLASTGDIHQALNIASHEGAMALQRRGAHGANG